MSFKISKRKTAVSAVILVVFFLFVLEIFSEGEISDATTQDLTQAEQCKMLCDQIAECSQDRIIEFNLAGCAEEYPCQKEKECTTIKCGGNPPDEIKEALGC